MMHEVRVICSCSDIEHCVFERYIADVRIAYAEIAQLRERKRPEERDQLEVE